MEVSSLCTTPALGFLAKRAAGLDAPIQMCDALSRNLPKKNPSYDARTRCFTRLEIEPVVGDLFMSLIRVIGVDLRSSTAE